MVHLDLHAVAAACFNSRTRILATSFLWIESRPRFLRVRLSPRPRLRSELLATYAFAHVGWEVQLPWNGALHICGSRIPGSTKAARSLAPVRFSPNADGRLAVGASVAAMRSSGLQVTASSHQAAEC